MPAFASVLKLKGTELQQQINELVATLAGPLGLERAASHEVATNWLVPRYFFSRATSIYGGSSEIQKEILARALLG
jgi:pimeloyl-CoA dehydrogenase